MRLKPLEVRLFPYTDDVQQPGWMVSLRHPYTGARAQGFYLTLCGAIGAYRQAVHRYHSGDDPLWYFDAPYAPEPPAHRTERKTR
jgi:hypothetical protein